MQPLRKICENMPYLVIQMHLWVLKHQILIKLWKMLWGSSPPVCKFFLIYLKKTKKHLQQPRHVGPTEPWQSRTQLYFHFKLKQRPCRALNRPAVMTNRPHSGGCCVTPLTKRCSEMYFFTRFRNSGQNQSSILLDYFKITEHGGHIDNSI